MSIIDPLDGENRLNVEEQPLLSIILPAHNEEHRLPPCLNKIDAFLTSQPFHYEVIIVENGSSDATLEVARDFAERYSYVRAMQVDTRGKGLAVQAGMLAAEGQYRFICDGTGIEWECLDYHLGIEAMLSGNAGQAAA